MRLPVEDLVGWMASLLTLITFAQSSMLPLRATAILANVFFIAYGAMGHFLPVLTLHAILLPLNSARLIAHVGKAGTGTSMLGFRAANRVSRDSAQDDPLRLEDPAQRVHRGLNDHGIGNAELWVEQSKLHQSEAVHIIR